MGLQSQGQPDERAPERVLQLGHRPLRRSGHDRRRPRGLRAGRAWAAHRRRLPRLHVHQRRAFLGRGERGLLQGHGGREASGGSAGPAKMTTAEAACAEDLVEVAGVRIQLRRGGSGAPLLILHSELGVPGWLRAYEMLAEHFTVYVPSLPGFGQSARPDWIASVRDLAAWVTWFVRDLQLPQPLNVIGCSMGGWIAAEIATVNATLFKKMVLVGAAGLKPEVGEVWDYFVHAPKEAFMQAFYDREQAPEYVQYYAKAWSPEEGVQVESNREM